MLKTRLAIVALCMGFTVPAAAACLNTNPDGTDAPSMPAHQFDVHDDGTITDAAAGLMWKRCLQGKSGPDCATGDAAEFRWVDALNDARGESFSGYEDWRLPKVDELCSIVAADATNPAVDGSVFPGTDGAEAWTASANLDFATGRLGRRLRRRRGCRGRSRRPQAGAPRPRRALDRTSRPRHNPHSRDTARTARLECGHRRIRTPPAH